MKIRRKGLVRSPRRTTGSRIRGHAALAAMALLPALLCAPATAVAAENAGPQVDKGFELRTPNREYLDIANEIRDQHTRVGVQTLLKDANRTAGTEGDKGCNAPEGAAHTFCFQPQVDGQGDDQNTEAWYPQGVTTVSDAVADEQWGARKPVVTSWYSKGDQGVRLSFLDPATKKYRHVLLMIPDRDDQNDPTLRPLTSGGKSIHAGGIAWYGKNLYVADTNGGIRVFNTDYILDLEGSGDPAAGDYRYVMLQVGAYVKVQEPAGECGTGPTRFSYIGLDRSTKPDRLITGEYCGGGKDAPNGRVMTWNLDNGRIAPVSGDSERFRPQEAHTLPTGYVQGASVHDGKWYFTHRGEGTGGYDKDAYYLSRATEKDGELVLDAKDAVGTPDGRGPSEDLSYYNSSDHLWTLTEKPGSRAIYSLQPPS